MVFKKPHVGFILSASLSHHKDVQGWGRITQGQMKISSILMRMLGFNPFNFLLLMSSSIFARFPNLTEPQLSHLQNVSNNVNS